jgi:hypothetical protein
MARHRQTKVRSKVAASQITNGAKLWLPGTDGRSAIARRTRDIFDAICRDLGGHDVLSEAQMQLVRRASLISIKCEELEARAVQGEAIDLDLFGQMTDRLGRCLQRLGIRRLPKNITPSVSEYLEHVTANSE